MRREAENSNAEVAKVRREIDGKMESIEGAKIWNNFKKYAQYNELQELYKKVVPEIGRFEEKLIASNKHMDQLDELMRRMDEVVCGKTDRDTTK